MIKLVAVSYQQCRLQFFKEQFAAAQRRLDWAVRHNKNWMELEDDGAIVSFYEWAVKMAEKEVQREDT